MTRMNEEGFKPPLRIYSMKKPVKHFLLCNLNVIETALITIMLENWPNNADGGLTLNQHCTSVSRDNTPHNHSGRFHSAHK